MASTLLMTGGGRLLGSLTKSNACSVFGSVSRVGRLQVASLSSSSSYNHDPSTFMQGVTKEDLEKDPVLAEYFAVNFPDYGKDADEIAKEEKVLVDAFGTPIPMPTIKNRDLDLEEVNSYPLNIRPMAAYSRDLESEEGTKKCYKLREEQNLIPGILYGGDPTAKPHPIQSRDPSSKVLIKTPWDQIQRELDRFTYHNFESRVYNLTVYENEEDKEGVVHQVIPSDVQHHPAQKKVYCVNYLRYFPGRPIKIPIVYINEDESAAMKRGGFVVPVNRHVSCVIEEGVDIPEAIELDLTGAGLKEVVRIDRLIFPDGVKPSKRVDPKKYLVGTIFGRRSEVGDEEDEDGADAA